MMMIMAMLPLFARFGILVAAIQYYPASWYK